MKKTIIICAVALIGFAAFAQDRQGMMARFTDSRFRGRRRDDGRTGYLPLLGAAKNVSVRPVDAFAQTKGASGGIDFWGNCWEWTATKRDGKNAVKGCAFDSKRTDCRTEAKNTAKDASKGYPNVTIRLVRESRNANQQDDFSHGDADSRRYSPPPP